MWYRGIVRSALMGLAATMCAGILGSAVAYAQQTESRTLIYATYDGQNKAAEVYKKMHSSQGATGERIESFAVVSKDSKGNVRVHDQRVEGAGVGTVVGAVVGLVGGPIGVAFGAGTGGVVGFLTGDAVGIPIEKVEDMKKALTPNSSALVVVLDDRWVKDVTRDMQQAKARHLIASEIAHK